MKIARGNFSLRQHLVRVNLAIARTYSGEMAGDYGNIDLVLANTKNHKAAAIDSYSKGLEILEELEEETGYHHPLTDTIQGLISELQKTRRRTKRK